jgi:hypothetical protein
VADACARCHAGNLATADAPQGKNVIADLNKLSSHNHPGPIDATKVVAEQSNCNDCHGSHSMGTGTAVAPTIPPALGAVSGVNSSGALVPRAQYEFEVCFKCHSGPGTAQVKTPTITRQIVQTDTRIEFEPSAVSFHPVQAPGKNADVPSLIPTLTTSSMIYCSDCHASETAPVAGEAGVKGPHGSNVSPLLSGEYVRLDNVAESPQTYALCYKCHERASILANESFTGHSKHIVDNNTPCSVCHDAHGISSAQGSATANAHLINFDISIVQRDRITGRLEYQTTGPRSGTCYLTCHNVDHSPRSYPAAGGVAPLPAPGAVISPTPSILRKR